MVSESMYLYVFLCVQGVSFMSLIMIAVFGKITSIWIDIIPVIMFAAYVFWMFT